MFFTSFCSSDADEPTDEVASAANQLVQERERLDETVWAEEVTAQRYEQTIVKLWDDLRRSKEQIDVLSQFPFDSIRFGPPANAESLDLGIRRIRFGDPATTLNRNQWLRLLDSFQKQGFELVETEWHHSTFSSGKSKSNESGSTTERTKSSAPTSSIDFVLHAFQRSPNSPPNDNDPRLIVRGKLKIEWRLPADDMPTTNLATANKLELNELEVLTRTGGPVFKKAFTYERRANDVASAHPIIVGDLDANGFPEILISRWNRIYWNQGRGKFQEAALFAKFVPLAESGLLADVNQDGVADFLAIDKLGRLIVFDGDNKSIQNQPTAENTTDRSVFPNEHRVAASVSMPSALAMTAGDVDRDGDIDLWVSQYKPAYFEGQMPTPYYDANDGEPGYLLLNDGTGNFVDATETSGLAEKRHRRTYSVSFVDVDADHDLDMLKVSDYAGVDLYRNDGKGHFTDATTELIDERHLFGMAHSLGDFNQDGLLDIYAIGMSSTTARRLDAMRLGRNDREDIHRMRAAMGFGNRMYVGNGKRFQSPPFAKQVARTGWSWGSTAFDFDLDGDQDIYVGNGFRSGDSCEDYCSTFWRHDIYTGDSKQNNVVANMFIQSMQGLNSGRISWNGYEHNALLQNLDGKRFANVGFLLGVGFEFDSRVVIGNDLDADGLPDLLVTEYQFVGRGFESKLHVYRNSSPRNNHWIGIRLKEEGKPSGLFGTTATLEANGQKQVRQLVSGDSFLAQHDTTFHFGLGKASNVERITIRWPNGITRELIHPKIDTYHAISSQ